MDPTMAPPTVDQLNQLVVSPVDPTLSLAAVEKSTYDEDSRTMCVPGGPKSLPTAGAPPGSAGRYHILRPHARGGLGEVFIARDLELNRDVALKEIQERFADHE